MLPASLHFFPFSPNAPVPQIDDDYASDYTEKMNGN
jgi:hypothetical protein